MKNLLESFQVEFGFWAGMIVAIFEQGFDIDVVKKMIERKAIVKKAMVAAYNQNIESQEAFEQMVINQFPEMLK